MSIRELFVPLTPLLAAPKNSLSSVSDTGGTSWFTKSVCGFLLSGTPPAAKRLFVGEMGELVDVRSCPEATEAGAEGAEERPEGIGVGLTSVGEEGMGEEDWEEVARSPFLGRLTPSEGEGRLLSWAGEERFAEGPVGGGFDGMGESWEAGRAEAGVGAVAVEVAPVRGLARFEKLKPEQRREREARSRSAKSRRVRGRKS